MILSCHSMALIQVVVFAESFFISVHALQPAIHKLMNARNGYKQ